jgi:hypothetical protein
MLYELLRHDLVTNGEVSLIEDLLEVAPNEFLVGLRHGYLSISETSSEHPIA